MARPSYAATDRDRAMVKAMASYGVQQEYIAAVLGIDPKTLRKHYREELDTAETLANAKVAESLFKKATGEGPSSVAAAIFWMKSRAGWSETKVEAPGKKERKQEAAEKVAAGKFAPRGRPKLAVNNG